MMGTAWAARSAQWTSATPASLGTWATTSSRLQVAVCLLLVICCPSLGTNLAPRVQPNRLVSWSEFSGCDRKGKLKTKHLSLLGVAQDISCKGSRTKLGTLKKELPGEYSLWTDSETQTLQQFKPFGFYVVPVC